MDFETILARVPENKRASVQAWWNALPQEHRERGLADLSAKYGQAIPVPEPVVAQADATGMANRPPVVNVPASVGAPTSRGVDAPKPWTFQHMLASGALGGGLDEASAALDAMQRGTPYADELARQQRAQADYLMSHPTSGRILEALGFAAGPIARAEGAVLGKVLGPGASLPMRVLAPTVTGGVTGAGVGALSAPMGQRAEGALLGGILGAPVGGMVGLAGPVTRGIRNIAETPSGDVAERVALADMRAAGRTVPQMQAELRGMAPDEPVTLGELIGRGDVSPSTKTQRAIYQIPGPGQAAMGRGLEAVESGVIDQVGNRVAQTTGVSRTNAAQALQRMRAEIDATANELYGPILDQPGFVGTRPIGEVVNNSYVQKYVIPRANRLLEARGMEPFPEGRAPNPRQLQYLKQAMDDIIDYSGPQESGGISRSEQAAVKELRHTLNTAMEQAIPGYAEANATIAPMIRARSRYADAAEFATVPADDLTAQWTQWSQGEREAYRDGAINSLLADLEQSGMSPSGRADLGRLKQRFSSPAQRQKLRLLFGRDTQRLNAYVERAMLRSGANRSILGGSSTAANAAGMGQLGEEAAAAMAAANAARGNLWGSLRDLWNLGGNRLRGITPETSQRLSDLYTAGIVTTPNAAGTIDRAALQSALERMGLAAERQATTATRPSIQGAQLAGILSQLLGNSLSVSAEQERRRKESR